MSFRVIAFLWIIFILFPKAGQTQQVNVLPSSINLGEVHLTPGETFTLSASFNIVCDYGNETFNATPTCSISSGNSWIQIKSTSAKCGDSVAFSGEVDPALESGFYTGYIHISCENIGSTSIPIYLKISREIGNILTLSPNKFSVFFTQANLAPKTFRIKIANANPQKQNFTWTAIPQVSWLEIDPDHGTGPSIVTLTVKPQNLPSGSFNGTVLFFSNLNKDSAQSGIPLNVNIQIYPSQELSVYPKYLFWSIEYTDNSSIQPLTRSLRVSSGPEGFSISSSAPWISLSKTSFDKNEDTVTISIIPDFIPNLGYGHHKAYLYIVDHASVFSRIVPVILEIRHPRDPITLPAQLPFYSQLFPDYLFIEVPWGGSLYLSIPLRYETSNTTSLKTYLLIEDAFNPGFLWAYYPWCGDISCVCNCLPENQKIYCLLNLPTLLLSNYQPFPNLFPVKDNITGETYPWTKCIAYSNGPISNIYFGPQIINKSSHFFIYSKIGNNFQNLKTIQTIEIKTFSPSGKWKIIDTFERKTYLHHESLIIKENKNALEGSWYGVPLTFYMGDGDTYLFGFIFSLKDITFEYQVTKITSTYMEGKWRYYQKDFVSKWYKFNGEKISNILD